ncbi:efflux RND transporter permease subunit [Roseibacillus ishigakijimensis]|uniref:Efflux RND transporter permease subunit n=1 Tax=Roseibacillus ishigakijimensis TaxID=454146 RepID=A0A934RN89_9BACT|nr:efflux RND transporter permease subunit [Roseibacillus ishigakijimensis]MBK1832782.1 efflux RND transporter permease subunit [Roseibacillus ishigakijimensis]
MKNLIQAAVRQPISVSVGVLLAVFAGILAISLVPVRMTPEVSSVVVSVTTNWESASAEEIESDIIEEQEKVLGEVTGLTSMISTSAAGQGSVRLEFETGTDIEKANAEVLQKLDEVPGYPSGVLQPVVEPIDIESVDWIAWAGLSSSDPDFPAETLYDLMVRRIKPRFERIDGISQVGIRGAVQSELHIRVDPEALAQRGITYSELRSAIQSANANFSGGRIEDGKRDLRLRATGRFDDPESIRETVIRRTEAGNVTVGDIATVEMSYKEPTSWVRARGNRMPFFNFQLERGANLLETMGLLKAEFAELNKPGGLLEQEAINLGMDGTLKIVQTYDSTTYVEDAIELVKSNIFVGGILATITLLFFLRSLRTVGIIAIAIPVSIVTSLVILVALGRSINIISLAGLAFAIGMVVDNAIVVIENIYRHLELGKKPAEAALKGTQEVAGAVLASTMTTLIVFAPILMIQETAGQLFRDIALAIMSAVGLSMIVSLTVIPTAAARFLKEKSSDGEPSAFDKAFSNPFFRILGLPFAPLLWLFNHMPDMVARGVARINANWLTRTAVVIGFTALTLVGTAKLLPPRDYLPKGNREIILSLLFPPPTYNLKQMSDIGAGIEEKVRPFWESTEDKFEIEGVLRGEPSQGVDKRHEVAVMPPEPGRPETIMPPAVSQYFLVSFEGRMFQVIRSEDKKRAIDAKYILQEAISGIPDTMGFAFQAPLFRVAGTTGSAIKIDVRGNDLDDISRTAGTFLGALIGKFGPYNLQSSPPNFTLPVEEVRLQPDDERLRENGLTRTDLGLATQAAGEGILLFRDYEQNGELKDIKLINQGAFSERPFESLLDTPVATARGEVTDLRSLSTIQRVQGPDQIRHVDRLRAVTLEVTPPPGLALETAIAQVDELVEQLKEAGQVAPGVTVEIAGSAGPLAEITTALVGDGTFFKTLTSSVVLALFVIYLLLVILFQSWSYPLVILLSVPLATFGGFLGLFLVHQWSLSDPYMPVQQLDVLTMLGFIILAGVVVNNAILIVHQTLNFMEEDPTMLPDDAIRESVRSRVRPILMSTLTSVGGMLPLVVLPGSGSELYRGLGAVVVGGLAVSTIFTMFLVPAVLSIVLNLAHRENTQPDHA